MKIKPDWAKNFVDDDIMAVYYLAGCVCIDFVVNTFHQVINYLFDIDLNI